MIDRAPGGEPIAVLATAAGRRFMATWRRAVDVGATVAAGERLGTIGDTRFAHLHFEVQRDGAVVDPVFRHRPGHHVRRLNSVTVVE